MSVRLFKCLSNRQAFTHATLGNPAVAQGRPAAGGQSTIFTPSTARSAASISLIQT
jgi:hypothetical protein